MSNKMIQSLIEQAFLSTGLLSPTHCGESFYVILGPNGYPRWVLPPYSPSVYKVLTQWRPYHWLSHVKWHVMCWAYRLGVLQYLPSVQSVQLNLSSVAWKRLGWLDATSTPTPLLYVGTPSTRQRAVLTLLSPDASSPGCVTKIPLSPHAKRATLHEGQVLQTLFPHYPQRVPRVLFSDFESGVVTQSLLLGALAPKGLTPLHLDFLGQLRQAENTLTLADKKVQLWQKLQALSVLDTPQFAVLLQRFSTRLNDTTVLPQVWVHGDFAPWNLKIEPTGHLLAIDWEAAEQEGLPLIDLVHYFFIQARVFQTDYRTLLFKPPHALINQYCERLHISPQLWPKIMLYYLLDSWQQRLADDALESAQAYWQVLQLMDAEWIEPT